MDGFGRLFGCWRLVVACELSDLRCPRAGGSDCAINRVPAHCPQGCRAHEGGMPTAECPTYAVGIPLPRLILRELSSEDNSPTKLKRPPACRATVCFSGGNGEVEIFENELLAF